MSDKNPGKAVWSLIQEENEHLRGEIERLTKELVQVREELREEEQTVSHYFARLKAAEAARDEARAALKQAEACMSMVEPRSDRAEYLRILGVVRAALDYNWSLPPRDPSG